ncbi:MAG: phenylalanine--tRNA ligase subunit beta [Candidatus Micrarchaeia archaeon]
MAVVVYDKEDLCALVGKDIPIEELISTIPLLGMRVEKDEGKEIHVDITPNRIDLLSVEGMARALSSFLSVRAGVREYGARDSELKFAVDRRLKVVRPYVVSALVKNVRIDDRLLRSLMQVQEKIHETFGRKRKKVAIGMHDFQVLRPPFEYKAVSPDGIKFIPLDLNDEMTPAEILAKHPKGIEYADILKNERIYPIITDSEGVVSFPPIINAERTRITEKTKEIFIEMTGTSKNALESALNVVCTMFSDRGAEIYTVSIEGRKTPNLSTKRIRFPLRKANALLGTNFSFEEAKKLVERMGLSLVGSDAVIPCYRPDIMHWVDVAEDMAIAYGYDKLEPTTSEFYSAGNPLERNEAEMRIKLIMIGMGFTEVVTFMLSNEKIDAEMMRIKEKEWAKLMNSRTQELSVVRTWLVPSLLSVLAGNKKEKMPHRIFEIGDAVAVGEGVNEKRLLAVAVAHPKACFSEIKSVAERLFYEAGMNAEFERCEHGSFIEGRCARISVGAKKGIIGEIHPEVLNNFGIEQPTAVFEIEI